jgi:LysM repeat protein
MSNPVARVIGAPPAPQTAAASSPPPPSGGGLAGLSRTQLYIGAAVLVAGFAALSAMKGKKSSADDTVTYEMDTTLSDIQSNFDQLNDKLDQFQDVPKPPVVTPPVVKPPVVVTPAPKPKSPITSVRYIVKQGDTLTSIGKYYKASPANIYGLNKGVILAAAKAHKRQDHGIKTTIYPGMVLTVPWGRPGQQGSQASIDQGRTSGSAH